MEAELGTTAVGDWPRLSNREPSPRLLGSFREALTILISVAALLIAATSAKADPMIAAAGDIACRSSDSVTADKCRQQYTANLLSNAGLSKVLPLGDLQYDTGLVGSSGAYGPTWGPSSVKSISAPVIGNHESRSDYYDYFNGSGNSNGPAGPRNLGYYSYDVGSWHLIALNSNCATSTDQISCAAGSPQEQWLRNDLSGNAGKCTLAYFHHARFSSGHDGDNVFMQPIWQSLYDAEADVVLAAHSHDYERFAPMDANGNRDSAGGIREFVVGTGGAFFTGISNIRPNSDVHQNNTYGILKLTLHPGSYDWEFVPESGRSFSDSGTANCHHGSSGGGTPTTGAGLINDGTGKKTLSYVANTGQTNNVTVTLSGGNYTLKDPGFQNMGDTDGAGGCSVSGSTATCPASGVTLIRVDTRDRDDSALVSAATDSVLLGGDGADSLTSDGGKDQLEGANGNDTLDAGAGNDLLDGGPGDDTMTGGAGTDTVDYSSAGAGVSVNLSFTTPQATGGLGTDTLSTLENIEGTPYNDTLTGDGSSNALNGYSGADTFNTRDGVSDTITCGSGTDFATTDSLDSYSSDCNEVDNGVPPETTITSKPPAKTDATTATFKFTASESPATFECRLDGGAWTACTTTSANYSGLSPGPHAFDVRSFDKYKNVDQTPATASWFVTAPPLASFEFSPPAPVVGESVAFESTSTALGTGNQIAIHEWDLDGNGTYETNTGTSPTTSQAYPSAATFTIGLRVTDVNGKIATTTKSLTIYPRPPDPPKPPTGGAGPLSPSLPDRLAPLITLAAPKNLRIGAGKLTVFAQCSESCSLTASATVKLGRASSPLSSRKVKIAVAANARAKLVLALSGKSVRAIRQALARGRHLVAKLTVISSDAAGNLSSMRRTIRLKA
jgi:Ca2+-binding RTX toxin-like protein